MITLSSFFLNLFLTPFFFPPLFRLSLGLLLLLLFFFSPPFLSPYSFSLPNLIGRSTGLQLYFPRTFYVRVW